MKKTAIFLLSMCVFNIVYAMQEKNKSKRRPKSIELGSLMGRRNLQEHSSKVDGISYGINSCNSFSPKWFDDMGKVAAKIFPIDDPLWFDAEYIARHEQLAGSILNDETEFWKYDTSVQESENNNKNEELISNIAPSDEKELWKRIVTTQRLKSMKKTSDAILPLNSSIENIEK